EKAELCYQDPIYGTITIPKQLHGLINSAPLQRLKKIHQNGIDYLIDARLRATRFEHSLGTMHLVRLLKGSFSEQLAALLHDISHTCFSHVVDVVFDNQKQNHHEKIRENFLQQSNL